MHPPEWTVQNLPWRDFGVRINSPDLIVDELGQPIKGAFISITASNISVESWRNYLQEHATSPTILQTDETMAERLETANTVRLVN